MVRNTAGCVRPSAEPQDGSPRVNGTANAIQTAIVDVHTFGANRRRGLPPNGIDFLAFQKLWRTRSPLKRLEPIMRGVRSMSIGRCGPGPLLVRRWPGGQAPLPGD